MIEGPIRRLTFWLILTAAVGMIYLGARAAMHARPCRPTPADCREMESDLGEAVRAEIEQQDDCTMPVGACGG